MDLNVDHYPNRNFRFFSFTPIFSIDLNQSVRERLKEGEALTKATALKIFKQIKLKSDVLSFITKPIVLIPLSSAILIAGFCIPPVGVALLATRVLVGTLGGGMLGYSIDNYLNNFLPQLSQAYSDQSARAAEYIQRLENSNQEFVITLA